MEGELRELTLALLPPVVVIVAVDIGAIFNQENFARSCARGQMLVAAEGRLLDRDQTIVKQVAL